MNLFGLGPNYCTRKIWKKLNTSAVGQQEVAKIVQCGERHVTLPVLSGTVDNLLVNVRSTGRVHPFIRFFRPESDICLSDSRN